MVVNWRATLPEILRLLHAAANGELITGRRTELSPDDDSGCPNAAMRFTDGGEGTFGANAGLPTVALDLLLDSWVQCRVASSCHAKRTMNHDEPNIPTTKRIQIIQVNTRLY